MAARDRRDQGHDAIVGTQSPNGHEFHAHAVVVLDVVFDRADESTKDVGVSVIVSGLKSHCRSSRSWFARTYDVGLVGAARSMASASEVRSRANARPCGAFFDADSCTSLIVQFANF